LLTTTKINKLEKKEFGVVYRKRLNKNNNKWIGVDFRNVMKSIR